MLTTPHNRDHQIAKLAVDINSASACRGAVRRKLLPSELPGFNLKKHSSKRSPTLESFFKLKPGSSVKLSCTESTKMSCQKIQASVYMLIQRPIFHSQF